MQGSLQQACLKAAITMPYAWAWAISAGKASSWGLASLLCFLSVLLCLLPHLQHLTLTMPTLQTLDPGWCTPQLVLGEYSSRLAVIMCLAALKPTMLNSFPSPPALARLHTPTPSLHRFPHPLLCSSPLIPLPSAPSDLLLQTHPPPRCPPAPAPNMRRTYIPHPHIHLTMVCRASSTSWAMRAKVALERASLPSGSGPPSSCGVAPSPTPRLLRLRSLLTRTSRTGRRSMTGADAQSHALVSMSLQLQGC